MGNRKPCRPTSSQKNLKRQRVEDVPGSSGDNPIEFEIVDPDPTSGHLTPGHVAADHSENQQTVDSTEQQKDEGSDSDSEYTVHKVFTGGYLHPYREMLFKKWRMTKKYTKEELQNMVEPGYWDGDRQHDPECMCYSCKLVWDK